MTRHDWRAAVNTETPRTLRAHALTVDCPGCGQPAGAPCIDRRTGDPLGRLPAHHTRIADADRARKEQP